jgi:hypothetical protein
MNKKVLGYSILIAALLLSVAGVAYAHWTKTITVDGYIITGSVDWCWFDERASEGDYGDLTGDIWPLQIGGGFGYEIFETYKDIAEAWIEIDEEDCKWLYFGVNRGYPCYMADFTVYPLVTGTVPVKIDHVELWLIPYEGAPESDWDPIEMDLGAQYVMLDWDDDGECDVEIGFAEQLKGLQLEPGSSAQEISWWLHICEDVEWTHYMADEQSRVTYLFALRLVCVNYNEYPIGS